MQASVCAYVRACVCRYEQVLQHDCHTYEMAFIVSSCNSNCPGVRKCFSKPTSIDIMILQDKARWTRVLKIKHEYEQDEIKKSIVYKGLNIHSICLT